MGAPKNFYNAVDLEKMGINNIDERILPDVSSSDNGKIAKVVEGKWALGDDNSMPSSAGRDRGVVLFADGNGGWTTSSSQNITEKLKGKVISKSLRAGETEVTFTNDNINSSSMIELYTDKFGYDPIDITQTGTHAIKVTFEADAVMHVIGMVVINA